MKKNDLNIVRRNNAYIVRTINAKLCFKDVQKLAQYLNDKFYIEQKV